MVLYLLTDEEKRRPGLISVQLIQDPIRYLRGGAIIKGQIEGLFAAFFSPGIRRIVFANDLGDFGEIKQLTNIWSDTMTKQG